MGHDSTRREAWQAPIPGVSRHDREVAPDHATYATIHSRKRILIDGDLDLGEPPVAVDDSTLVFRSQSRCGSDLTCFRRVRLHVPEGTATFGGTLCGTAVVLVFASATARLVFAHPLALPSGLEVVHGSVEIPDSPTTPVATQGGMEHALQLVDRSRLAALDLGSRLELVSGLPGRCRAEILGALRVHANGAFAPDLVIGPDGSVGGADWLDVGGDVELDTGARVRLPVTNEPLQLPADGLPLIRTRGRGRGALLAHPDPDRYVTVWRDGVLSVRNR